MAIRTIKEATLACDDCGKELARITSSLQGFAVLDAEAKYTEIRCISHAPIAP